MTCKKKSESLRCFRQLESTSYLRTDTNHITGNLPNYNREIENEIEKTSVWLNEAYVIIYIHTDVTSQVHNLMKINQDHPKYKTTVWVSIQRNGGNCTNICNTFLYSHRK